MTASGVQNIDSSAYLPPPPSASSTSDAKGASGANTQNAQTPGEPSDFQNELASQQGGSQQADPAHRPKTAPKSASKNSEKPGKSDKTSDKRADDTNLSTVTPPQLAELQKPILPIALALPHENVQPPENGKADDATKSDDTVALNATPQQLSQPAVQAPIASVVTVTDPTPLQKPEPAKLSSKSRQASAENAAPRTSGLPLASPTPASDSLTKSETSSAQNQVQAQDLLKTSGASSDSQPASPADLKLPTASPEPVSPAIQETADSTPSSPSALAFAARLAGASQASASQSNASQKAVETVAANAPLSVAPSGSQPTTQIPMRYAATAQIIQSTAVPTEPNGTKKDIDALLEKSAGPDARTGERTDARTDMVLPRFEAVSAASSNSGSAAPQPAAPAPRAETIIEPPAAPPTSSHDIRVRVPDNNGGSTQVRFVESGGEVRVSVRTSDEGLAQNLRTHLNDLTQRLSDGGTPAAEVWKPVPSAASSQNDSHNPNQDGANQNGSNQDGRGSGGQGSGGQGGQQDRQQNRPAWLEEMEASLHGKQN